MKEQIRQLEAERDALMAAWMPENRSDFMPAEQFVPSAPGWRDKVRNWFRSSLATVRASGGSARWDTMERVHASPPL
jgi:hypothetical protein